MAHFEEAHEETDDIEGFYSVDPKDSGGETLWGIARVKRPDWYGWRLVDAMKKLPNFPNNMRHDQALKDAKKAFYKSEYWDALRLDDVNSKVIAKELYDTGVNCGTVTAGKFLQSALNVSNKNGALYADLVVDGKIGPATIKALNSHPKQYVIYKLLNVLQGAHYIRITEQNPKNERFLNGWIDNRVFEHDFK